MLRLRVGNVVRFSVALAAIGSYPVIGKSVSAFMSVKLVTAWLGGGGRARRELVDGTRLIVRDENRAGWIHRDVYRPSQFEKASAQPDTRSI